MPLNIIRQDITKMKVDAIVNTTNENMIGTSGVDFAVHTAAGPELDKYCERIAPLGLGTAKITPAFNLPCEYIIHTSGPVWHGWEFLFIDANIDAVETARRYGIDEDRAVNYHADSKGTGILYESVACAVTNVRRCAPLDNSWRENMDKDYKKRGNK